MRVCVFGASSKSTPKKYLDAAFKLGELIAESNYVCVNGGGKNGCMGAVSNGTLNKNGKVVAVIHEMFCVDGEEALYVTERIISKGEDLTERKQLLYENGDCIISLPGGVGTFDEIWESVSHKSLGMKGLTNKPIVLLNTDGFYDGFILQLNRAFDDSLLYQPVSEFFFVANTPEEALDYCASIVLKIKSTTQLTSSINSDIDDLASTRKIEKAYSVNTLDGSTSIKANNQIINAVLFFSLGAVIGTILSKHL